MILLFRLFMRFFACRKPSHRYPERYSHQQSQAVPGFSEVVPVSIWNLGGGSCWPMVLPHGSSSSMGSSWMPEPYPQTYKLSPLEALCRPQRVLGAEPVDRRAGGDAAVHGPCGGLVRAEEGRRDATLTRAAEARGLGVCWAGYLTRAAGVHATIRQALSVPEGYVVSGGLMLGERKYSYRLVPPRKPLSVQWI